MNTYYRRVNGYTIRLQAASPAQADVAARQFALLPLPTLAAFEREDMQAERGSMPEAAYFLRCTNE